MLRISFVKRLFRTIARLYSYVQRLITLIRNKNTVTQCKKISSIRYYVKLRESILAMPLIASITAIIYPVALHSFRNASIVSVRKRMASGTY